MAEIIGGGTPSTTVEAYWNGDIDWYSPIEMSEQIYVDGSQKKITNVGLKKSSAKILPAGTVLFTSRAGIGKTAILAKEGTTNQGFQSIVPYEDKLDSYFIYSRTDVLKRYGEVNGGGSTFAEVSGKQMSKMPLLIPKLNEQVQIGSFFKQLDDTITLHQRKLDKLKRLKQGYLQQLFPKNDEKVPSVRFANFDEDWKQCRLGKLLTERNEQITENEEYPLMSFVQGAGVTPKGDRYDRSFLVKDNNKKYKKTELGDFIYSSNNLETGSIGFNRTGKAVISPVYSIFESRTECESQFIGILSTRKDFINKMIHYRQGVVYGQWRIHEKDFLNIEIYVPNKNERERIVDFINSVDLTITLHQSKLDKLKECKQAFLQKMFI